MWSDTETEIDYLNFAETASLVADVIRSDHLLPVSIGVFGGWGVGKSSLLRLTAKEVREKLKGDDTLEIINFDAWLFQGYDDARSALLQTIGERLLERAKGSATLREKAVGLLKRVNYLRLLSLGVDVGTSVAFGMPLGTLGGKLVSAVGQAVAGHATPEGIAGAKDDAKKIAAEGGGLLAPVSPQTPPEEINAFRSEFSKLLNDMGLRLVVVIDNLDRCLPQATIHTLEAIRLFLFLPSTAFVVAADQEMIHHAAKHHYSDLSEKHVTDYVDKLIQIPVSVPLLGVQEVRAYMMLLFASAADVPAEELEELRLTFSGVLRASWKGERITKKVAGEVLHSMTQELSAQLDLADRLAPILATAPNVKGNPRTIKRLMNALSMRMSLANKHGIVVDEPVLAKLAILERASQPAYEHLVELVNRAEGGAPTELAEIEKAEPGSEDFRERTIAWEVDETFMGEWVAIEPRLAGRDLRSSVYLTRERQGLVYTPGELSARAASVLRALEMVQSPISKNAATMVSSLPSAEHADVMNGLIRQLRQVPNWDSQPHGFAGALILAEASATAADLLVAFLKQSVPTATMGAWIIPLLEGRKWAKDLTTHVKNAKDGPVGRLKKLNVKRAE